MIHLWFMNHKSISWSHKTKLCKASIFHKLFFPKCDMTADDICLSTCLKLNVRLNNKRIKLSFSQNNSFFLNSNPGLNYTITLIYTNCRARLYETRSELKPIWNLEPLWKVVLFTWQFHCGNFPSHTKILFHMCKW